MEALPKREQIELLIKVVSRIKSNYENEQAGKGVVFGICTYLTECLNVDYLGEGELSNYIPAFTLDYAKFFTDTVRNAASYTDFWWPFSVGSYDLDSRLLFINSLICCIKSGQDLSGVKPINNAMNFEIGKQYKDSLDEDATTLQLVSKEGNVGLFKVVAGPDDFHHTIHNEYGDVVKMSLNCVMYEYAQSCQSNEELL